MDESTAWTVNEYIAKWYRSRERDGDSEYMAGFRFGIAKMSADLLGRPYREVKEALERGELRESPR
jgi:hypothetical protein